ncbi:cytochrome c3 [Denitrovibrio acetiphilus DSM 12809]|uniref:Cytochrome c3 n=1 Tax=Denitrovibrio acetiphilus (strain DSM 12809 / NBRC 114555 / N2460) TaxID=522772 RepID=D4H0M7_DENA2|nr:cytochrome c3 family protein [Denitrovibrio acetiphilus]ADD68540.1 cytochrome c3 [Denitrovibrio acetiphilus DSM 12809]
MKKIVIAMLVVFSVALVAFAATSPEKVNLAEQWGLDTKKPAVEFPHAFHQTKNECIECHMTAEGGALKSIKTGKEFNPKALVASGDIKKGKTKNPAHDEFCWECHKAKKVPKGKSCSTCHK